MRDHHRTPFLSRFCFYLITKSICLMWLAICTIGCDDSDQSAEPVLRFSAIPDQNSTELQEKFGALANYLSEALGVKVQYTPANDYKSSVERFKNGDIQLAWFGGLTGVQARRAVHGARAIVQGEEDPVFFSYFIAHEDTEIKYSDEFPREISKFTFTFGSASSTSGRLMPEYFIRRYTNRSPSELFEVRPSFSGDHDKTVELVEAGQVQVGAVNYMVYDKRVAAGTTDPNVCKIIWKTPQYADYNFTAHPVLDRMFGNGFIEKLQAVLIAVDDPKLLLAFPRNALIKATNEDFEAIEQVAEVLGFLR